MDAGLDLAHRKLGWPKRECVLSPPGTGPSVFASLARRKIQHTLGRLAPHAYPEVGILAADPGGSATDAPFALVCEFKSTVGPHILREAHKLAWNFCHSPLLVTLEPNLIRAWTCCRSPKMGANSADHAELVEARGELRTLSAGAARALGWVELVSGTTLQTYDRYFRRSGRLDQCLLSNLRFARALLLDRNLREDTCHDLLARIMFTQFLFDRRDSRGYAALDRATLRRVRDEAGFSADYEDLKSILRNHADTYKLFRWLNNHFNGDLFPGKGQTPADREAEWQAEMDAVRLEEHLTPLADLVSGTIDMGTGQSSFWPEYSFDTIPLEFISSIYEEFVKRDKPKKEGEAPDPARHGQREAQGVHYTPEYLVDLILDSVLPWQGKEWKVRILDPACGSGIFLVKAFQRLIQRWRNAHPGLDPKASTLKDMLQESLFGVDIDRNAVRVASFSLYLAMCDEIDPKYYWTQVRFPRMMGNRLKDADFFREDVVGFRTVEDAGGYDLVVGNAPWGKDTDTPDAREWAHRDPSNQWPIPNNSIGPLFLPKAAALSKPDGQIAMLQPAGVLLFNSQPTAVEFRRRLFTRFSVTRITNLSALRFGLFRNAVSPSCIIELGPNPPIGEPAEFICPRPSRSAEDDYRVVIDPYGVSRVALREMVEDPHVWPALAWGGRRDLALIRRLKQFDTLEHLEKGGAANTRRGICPGDKKQEQKALKSKPILKTESFPDGTFLYLDSDLLPINDDPYVHSRDSTDMSAFQLPQLIIKETWQSVSARFRAALVKSSAERGPVICTRSYISVHAPEPASVLDAACLAYNSILAPYFFFLTSGRFASYRPEPPKKELLRLPIPPWRPGILDGVKDWGDLDRRVFDALGFIEGGAERSLVEDLVRYVLPELHGASARPGRESTRGSDGREAHLTQYCDFVIRVLKAGFGENKQVAATIFQEPKQYELPIRLVAIHLDWPGRGRVSIEPMAVSTLRTRLAQLHAKGIGRTLDAPPYASNLRFARVYDTLRESGSKIPTVYLVKPDQKRFWTRSMALRDADDVASDIILWRSESQDRSSRAREARRA